MRFEHKLSAELAGFAQATMEKMRERRKDYLAALGQAKEAEMENAALQRALETQLEIVRQVEQLPAARTPWTLNAEATALVADVDVPEAPSIDPEVLPAIDPVSDGKRLNGSAVGHEYAE